jgi:chromosome segregation ATPase
LKQDEKNFGKVNPDMSHFITRLEKNIVKLEKRIEKEYMQIEHLRQKMESKKITRADFTIRKKHIEEKIHGLNARMRVLKGGITKEKRHIDEKEEKKQKKKEEKEKKKGKKKKSHDEEDSDEDHEDADEA